VIRRIGNMLQMVGQGATQAARSSATSNTTPTQSANKAFLEQGTIVRSNPDGTYEVTIDSDQGQRQTCAGLTDECLLDNTMVWVSKTISGEYVIHGSIK
jgi:hypothetical protein